MKRFLALIKRWFSRKEKPLWQHYKRFFEEDKAAGVSIQSYIDRKRAERKPRVRVPPEKLVIYFGPGGDVTGEGGYRIHQQPQLRPVKLAETRIAEVCCLSIDSARASIERGTPPEWFGMKPEDLR